VSLLDETSPSRVGLCALGRGKIPKGRRHCRSSRLLPNAVRYRQCEPISCPDPRGVCSGLSLIIDYLTVSASLRGIHRHAREKFYLAPRVRRQETVSRRKLTVAVMSNSVPLHRHVKAVSSSAMSKFHLGKQHPKSRVRAALLSGPRQEFALCHFFPTGEQCCFGGISEIGDSFQQTIISSPLRPLWWIPPALAQSYVSKTSVKSSVRRKVFGCGSTSLNPPTTDPPILFSPGRPIPIRRRHHQ